MITRYSRSGRLWATRNAIWPPRGWPKRSELYTCFPCRRRVCVVKRGKPLKPCQYILRRFVCAGQPTPHLALVLAQDRGERPARPVQAVERGAETRRAGTPRHRTLRAKRGAAANVADE